MQALMIAAPMLGLIGLGVAGVGLFGRDPQAEEHDLSDYHEPARPVTMLRRIDFDISPEPESLDILPPAPPGMRVSLPLYAEQVIAEQMRERYGTTSPDVIAGRMLREIAGIRPAYATDRRDMTGAFPVVRAD